MKWVECAYTHVLVHGSSTYIYSLRGGRPAEDAPVSLFMHSFGGNLVVLALCQDVHLRLWATEVTDLVYNIMF